jgi:hypothetical protein
VDAQPGYAVLVKSVNQDGTAPWSVTEDVTFTDNTITDTDNGISIQGYAADQPGGITKRVGFYNNNITCRGKAVQIGGPAGDITFVNNTFNNGWTFLTLYGGKISNLILSFNTWLANGYGIKGDSTAAGTPTLEAYTEAYTLE